jgi:hypothetical protein
MSYKLEPGIHVVSRKTQKGYKVNLEPGEMPQIKDTWKKEVKHEDGTSIKFGGRYSSLDL